MDNTPRHGLCGSAITVPSGEQVSCIFDGDIFYLRPEESHPSAGEPILHNGMLRVIELAQPDGALWKLVTRRFSDPYSSHSHQLLR